MAKQNLGFREQPGTNLRPARRYRPYLWSLASWLKNGGIAAAFYVAWRAGAVGAVALGFFLSGIILRGLLDATSTGD